MNDTKTLKFAGTNGRDNGKHFQLTEIETTQKASFVLRLVASLRVDSWENLLERFAQRDDSKPPIDLIMSLLSGSDPASVELLMHETLRSVQIAPDPRYPEAFRQIEARDIRELATLGEIIIKFATLNLSTGL